VSQSQGTQLSVTKKSNVLDKPKPNILNAKKQSNHDASNNNNSNSVDNNDSGVSKYDTAPTPVAAPAVPEVTVSSGQKLLKNIQ
jgi:hypothetical protein